MIYAPALKAAGFDVEVRSMFSDSYLAELYGSGRRSPTQIIAAYWRRIIDVLRAGAFDVVWLEKELFPFWPGAAERMLAATGTRYIVDFDDAVFHRYDQHASRLVRLLFAAKMKPLLRRAFAASVGNRYLAAWAAGSGAGRIEVIPTVVDLGRYPRAAAAAPDAAELRIGWIGNPLNTAYLWLLRDALRELAARRRIKLVTVGASSLAGLGVPVEQHPWTPESEVQLLMRFDAGIMPLPDSAFERGKCGYKLIQYFACGKPAVASPVGANVDIIGGKEVGFLAESPAQWIEALEKLAASQDLRTRMGSNGRRLVEREFSLEAAAPRVIAMMDEACR